MRVRKRYDLGVRCQPCGLAAELESECWHETDVPSSATTASLELFDS